MRWVQGVLALAVLLLGVGVGMAKAYVLPELKIGGVKVDITKSGDLDKAVYTAIKKGTVNWNAETKTLTLDGATIECTDQYALYAENFEKFILVVKEKNTLSASNNSVLQISAIPTTGAGSVATITGANGASLTCTAGNFGIMVDNVDLTIRGGCKVTSTGFGGIVGGVTANSSLTISGSTVEATGSAYSIGDFRDMTFKYCDIIQPLIGDAQAFELPRKGVVSKRTGELVTTMVTIQPVLHVKGIPVTEENASKVLGDASVRYDEANKTLTLENANIEAEDKFGIQLYGGEYTLQFVGNNKVTSKVGAIATFGTNLTIKGAQDALLKCESNGGTGVGLLGGVVTITGKGSIEVEGTGGSILGLGDVAIQGSTVKAKGQMSAHALSITQNSKVTVEGNGDWGINATSLDIQNSEVKAVGKKKGIAVEEKSTVKESTVEASGEEYGILAKKEFTVDHSTVTAHGGKASIEAKDLPLTNCEFYAPDGAAFDAGVGSVVKDGVAVTEVVRIAPFYKLLVASGVENGKVEFSWNEKAPVGSEVKLRNKPSEGYQYKPESLRVYKKGDTKTRLTVKNWTFTMPSYDVEVSCKFEVKPTEPTAVESAQLGAAMVLTNPVDDELRLTGVSQAQRLEVYSLLGQLRYTLELQGADVVAVPTMLWPDGVYVVRLVAPDGVRTLKAVVRH